MSDLDFRQPDPGPQRPAAEPGQLAHAASGLVTAYGYRLADPGAGW